MDLGFLLGRKRPNPLREVDENLKKEAFTDLERLEDCKPPPQVDDGVPPAIKKKKVALESKKPVVTPSLGAIFNSSCSDPKADGQLIVNCGKSERGKSHFTRWLLRFQKDSTRCTAPLKFGLIFISTKFANSYKEICKDMPVKVIEGYSEIVLRRYVDNLKSMHAKGTLAPNFVLFEDCVGILANQTRWFQNWITTFRHLRTRIIINSQDLCCKNAVSTTMRVQTNIAIMWAARQKRTLVNLYENYGQLFSSFKEFEQYLIENTSIDKVGPYACVVYLEKEDDITKNYLAIRAPPEE